MRLQIATLQPKWMIHHSFYCHENRRTCTFLLYHTDQYDDSVCIYYIIIVTEFLDCYYYLTESGKVDKSRRTERLYELNVYKYIAYERMWCAQKGRTKFSLKLIAPSSDFDFLTRKLRVFRQASNSLNGVIRFGNQA